MTTKTPHVVVEPRNDGGYAWYTSDDHASGSVYHSHLRGGWVWRINRDYREPDLQPDGEPAYRWPHEALAAVLVAADVATLPVAIDRDTIGADARTALTRLALDHGWAGLRAIVTREANRAALERMTPAQLAALRAREHAEEIEAIRRGA